MGARRIGNVTDDFDREIRRVLWSAEARFERGSAFRRISTLAGRPRPMPSFGLEGRTSALQCVERTFEVLVRKCAQLRALTSVGLRAGGARSHGRLAVQLGREEGGGGVLIGDGTQPAADRVGADGRGGGVRRRGIRAADVRCRAGTRRP
jgi:hypothetical protein